MQYLLADVVRVALRVMRERHERGQQAAGAWSLPSGMPVLEIDSEERLDCVRYV